MTKPTSRRSRTGRGDSPDIHGAGIFVAGTDTGVGKTWTGARLIAVLAGRGLRVAPRKPLESGWKEREVELTDAGILAAAVPGGVALDTVCRWRFPETVSPARAAELAGIHVRLAEVTEACRSRSGEFALVEGAGGFFSPLTADALNADLAEALELPVVLVAADRLGCINHTLLSAAAIAGRGLVLSAVVLNRAEVETDPAMDNATDLRLYLECPIVCSGHAASPETDERWAEELADIVTGRSREDQLLNRLQ